MVSRQNLWVWQQLAEFHFGERFFRNAIVLGLNCNVATMLVSRRIDREKSGTRVSVVVLFCVVGRFSLSKQEEEDDELSCCCVCPVPVERFSCDWKNLKTPEDALARANRQIRSE